MRSWAALFLIGLTIGWPATGHAAHQLFESPPSAAVPGRVQKEGVSVDAQILDAEATEDVFSVNLIRKGVQPIVIEIHNGSQATYQFRKADVDARYLPAAVAAKAAYENPVAIGGEIVERAKLSLHQFIFPPPKRVPFSPILNRDVQESFVKEEIPDAEIGPNSSLSGFLYLRPLAPGATFRVTLVNLQTQQPLIFEIARGPN